MSKSEAYCNCTGEPPWPVMLRLHARGPDRYYLCRECGAILEYVYKNGAISDLRWHDQPDTALPQSVVREARAVLEKPTGEQLSLWEL
jgi:hypothetical protein